MILGTDSPNHFAGQRDGDALGPAGGDLALNILADSRVGIFPGNGGNGRNRTRKETARARVRNFEMSPLGIPNPDPILASQFTTVILREEADHPHQNSPRVWKQE